LDLAGILASDIGTLYAAAIAARSGKSLDACPAHPLASQPAPMNYRHAYHAGNFADVVKHAVLALVLAHLSKKEAAWRFIDTHAGPGATDLSADQPARTGEWRDGIGRIAVHLGLKPLPGSDIAAAPAPAPPVRAALAPYAQALLAANPDGVLRTYPGSPQIARALARRQDRLTLCEIHPEDGAALRARFAGDQNVKAIEIDGWLALGAFVPPKERRGVVLVDPPFEEPGEFERLVDGLVKAHQRWPTGIYCLWHPIKDEAAVAAYERALRATSIPKILFAELFIRERPGTTFDGCGLAIVNPPYMLEANLRAMLPYLSQILAQGPGADYRIASAIAKL
jgi:23S rRNA (adenine2030-N6)-methyltransferase